MKKFEIARKTAPVEINGESGSENSSEELS